MGVVSPRSSVTEMITLVRDFASEWLVLVLSNSYFDGKNNFQCLYNTAASSVSFSWHKSHL